MLEKFDTIDSITKFKNPYWEYKEDKYVLPSGGRGEYHYINSRGATVIIPRLDNGYFILVEQYRYLNKKHSLEFPGGGIKINNEPFINAKEELVEETGYISDDLQIIGEFNPYNGVTNEICFVFVANNLIKNVPKPDNSEEFKILYLLENDINNKIIKGEIWDGMTLAAWSIYQLKSRNID
jgi:ADP-ribose pyrophosphatase